MALGPVLPSVIVVGTANLTSMTGLSTTIDGVALSSANMRVLLVGQASAATNGVWLTQSGAWTRPTDFPHGSIADGVFVEVEAGSNYAGTIWALTGRSITIDTTAQAWVGQSLFPAPPPSGDATGATDYAVLQALLNRGSLRLGYAPSSNPYIINQTLSVPAFAAIVGLGMELSVIQQSQSASQPVLVASATYMTNNGGTPISAGQPVYLRDFTIDTNPNILQTAVTDGLAIMNLRSAIERVRILHPSRHGIIISDQTIHGDLLSNGIVDCLIRGCRVDFVTSALQFSNSDLSGTTITIHGNTATGVLVDMPVFGPGVPVGAVVTAVSVGASDTTVTISAAVATALTNQTVQFAYGNRGYWIRSDTGAAQSITDCYFENNISNGAWGGYGCRIESADGWFIRGNHIYGNQQNGMYIDGAFVAWVQNNRLDNFGLAAISGNSYTGIDITGVAGLGSIPTPITFSDNEVNTTEASGVSYTYYDFHHLPGNISQTITFGVNNAWRKTATVGTSSIAFQFDGPTSPSAFYIKGGHLLTTQGEFTVTGAQVFHVSGTVNFVDTVPGADLATLLAPDYLQLANLAGALCDPAMCSSNLTLAGNTLYLARLVVRSSQISTIVLMVQSAGSGPTGSAAVGVFDPTSGALVASLSGSTVNTALTTGGTANLSLTTALSNIKPGTQYFVGVWVPTGWTTYPALRTVPAVVAAVNVRSGFRTATITGVASFPSTLPTLAAAATGPWIGAA
jgi:hypothetical protein